MSPILSLHLGEIRSIPVTDVKRVAVGNPDIVDVTIVSSNEVLLQAKSAGTTNLILWDRQGQHVSNVQVVDRAADTIEPQLRKLILELHLPSVAVNREDSKLFLTGQVPRQEDLDRLEQLLAAFPGVTNLVSVSSAAAPGPSGVSGPLIKLAVQILEISRKDLEQLGVKWSESVSLTEPEATDQTVNRALFHWGTSLTRTSVAAALSALVQQNRARVLSEPKLVTTDGKEASSFIGLEVPIVTATSFGTATSTVSASIEFRKTGVLLKMTPHVLPEDKVTTMLEAEVSGIDSASGLKVPVGSQTVLVPGFKVRRVTTEVTSASGDTVIIAGLLEAEDSREVSQVPALGSMPVLGRLFRSPSMSSTQRELIITMAQQVLPEPRAGVQTPEVVLPSSPPTQNPDAPSAHAQPSSPPASSGTPMATQAASPLPEAALADALQQAKQQVQERASSRLQPPLEDVSKPSGPVPPSAEPQVVTDVTIPVNDPRLRYAVQVHERIAEVLRSLVHRNGLTKPVTVRLKLHLSSDGTLQDVQLLQSSGMETLDAQVLTAAQTQVSYPAFPKELTERELWLEVPITYTP